MKYLTEEYWALFKKDGKLFEELTQQILKLKYPTINWVQTAKSWDGKRDFFTTINIDDLYDVKIWAECKQYSVPLSINVLSPTLVMSIIEDVNTILFFSRSKINKNARIYLSKFSQKHNIKIKLFDDEALEELIFQYSLELSCFFPGYKFLDNITNRLTNFEYDWFISFPYIEKDLPKNILSEHYFYVNEIFSIIIMLENKKNHESCIKLFVEKSESNKNLQIICLNETQFISLKLPGHSICSYKFDFKILKYNKRIKLPAIGYVANSENQYIIKDVLIKCKFFIQSPLIGSEYLHILDEFENYVSIADLPAICLVHGSSGVGKSRLLNELSDRLYEKSFQIIRLNGENNNHSLDTYWLRFVLSAIYKMPELSEEQTEQMSKSSNYNLLLDIMYNPDYNVSANVIQVAELLYTALYKEKFVLIIDNLQFFDNLMYDILNYIFTFNNQYTYPTKIILSVNTDFLIKDSNAANLFFKVKNLQKDIPKRVKIFKISGFTDDTALMYIDNSFGKNVTSYNKSTYIHLIENCNNNPLYIEQTLLYLLQSKAICYNGCHYSIVSPEEFNKIVISLPDNIKDLIDMRWNNIEPYLVNGQKDLIKLLSFFKKMKICDIEEFHVSQEDLRVLSDLGIIKETQDNEITFNHQMILHYFSQKFRNYSREFYEHTLYIIEQFDLYDDYTAQFFIASLKVRPSNVDILEESIQYLLNDYISYEFLEEYETVLKEILKFQKYDIQFDYLKIIKLFIRFCYDSKIFHDFEYALKEYESFDNIIIRKLGKFKHLGKHYFDFVKEYANTFILLHKDKQCIEFLKKAFINIDNFSFDVPQDKLYAKSNILNRLGVVYKSIGNIDLAKKNLDNSWLIAEEICNYEMKIRNCFDYGNLYYKNAIYNDEVVKWWNRAYDLQIAHAAEDINIEKRYGGVCFHKAIVNVISHLYDEADYYIKEAYNFFDHNLTVPFYRIKLLLLEAIILFFRDDPKQMEEKINEAQDLCIQSSSNRSYYNCFYLRAKYGFLVNNKKLMKENFIMALYQIHMFASDGNIENRYAYFYEDLALTFRTFHIDIDEEAEKNIRSEENLNRVHQILDMPEKEFQLFKRNYRAVTSISDISKTINMPCP